MAEPKINVGVVIECLFPGFVDVRGFERDGLVADHASDLDAAMPVTLLTSALRKMLGR